MSRRYAWTLRVACKIHHRFGHHSVFVKRAFVTDARLAMSSADADPNLGGSEPVHAHNVRSLSLSGPFA
jgi:hypothetical protein